MSLKNHALKGQDLLPKPSCVLPNLQFGCEINGNLQFPPLKKVLYFARKRQFLRIAFCRYATMGVTNSLSLMLPNSCVPSVASEQSSSDKFGRTKGEAKPPNSCVPTAISCHR